MSTFIRLLGGSAALKDGKTCTEEAGAARLSAACGLPEALRRFSREIEHNEDNVEALLDAFRFTFTQEDFLAELAK